MCVCVPRYVVVVVVVAASVISTSFHAPRLERRGKLEASEIINDPWKEKDRGVPKLKQKRGRGTRMEFIIIKTTIVS